MEKRNHNYWNVIAIGCENEWNMFFGDFEELEEAERHGAIIEGGDILTVHEYGICNKTFPSLKAAKKFVAHAAGVPVSQVEQTTWLNPNLPAEDWRHQEYGFLDEVRWEIREI